MRSEPSCTSCSRGARRPRRWCAPFATCCRHSPRRPARRFRASAPACSRPSTGLWRWRPSSGRRACSRCARALSGDMAPPPPSPRQLGAPVAVAPDSAPAPVAAARTARAHDASPERPRFSRLAATFWGPAADLDPPPSRSRRRAHLSVAASLALAGTVALGWGAWTLNRPSLPPSIDAVSTPEAAVATTTKAVGDIGGRVDASVGADDAIGDGTGGALGEAGGAASVRRRIRCDCRARVDRPQAIDRPLAASGAGCAARIAIGRRHVPRSRRRALPPSRHAPRRTHATATGMLARAWCAMTPCKAPRGPLESGMHRALACGSGAPAARRAPVAPTTLRPSFGRSRPLSVRAVGKHHRPREVAGESMNLDRLSQRVVEHAVAFAQPLVVAGGGDAGIGRSLPMSC